MLFTAVLILHITFAAMLFGVPLGLVGAARRALAAGPTVFKAVALETERRGKLAGMSGLLTFLSGVALIFVRGGFGAVSKNFHIAMTVMLLAIVFSATWMRPNAAKLVEASQQEPQNTDLANASLKKLAMGSGILHTLWLVILGLMLFHF